MSVLKPLVVRALELASDRKFATNREIRERLRQEGYVRREIEEYFNGLSFRRQLKALRQESLKQ
jgi:hypothetical protein